MTAAHITDPGQDYRVDTLVELLRKRVRTQPGDVAYRFLVDGENEEIVVSYVELDRQARAIGAWLQSIVAANERALLLYPPGLEYIAAFFGCLYAGVIAVPAYPPRLNRPVPRIQGIVADSKPAVALTTTSILENIEQRFEHAPDLEALRWLNTEKTPQKIEENWQEPQISPDWLAFLQYTSGSTSQPKGVMLSHGNLTHNLEAIRVGFRIDPQGCGVFWLPSYHDMGLIGGILEPLYVGRPSTLFSPVSFLQRPMRWVEAISRFRATISGAPNFAYELCVEKSNPEQIETLDLSCWATAFCGAEPVRQETLEKFAQTFKPSGFKSSSFYPCYGLAEGSLLVSGGEGPHEPVTLAIDRKALEQDRVLEADPADEDDLILVGCGRAVIGQQTAIVDPQSLSLLDEGEVGEVWVSGPSIARGYWDRPDETQKTFNARITGEDATYLRTGDLGFKWRGELFITGRLKDLIIIRGRNYYPQDLEATAESSHEALQPGAGAAFSINQQGVEQLVVVFEVARQHRHTDIEQVVSAVRRAIAETHELQLHAFVLVKPLSIPKTSSGKIKRHACKSGFLDGTLAVLGEWRAPAPEEHKSEAKLPVQETNTVREAQPIEKAGAAQKKIEAWLVEQISRRQHLALGDIDVRQPFVQYGLDSVQAVELTGELEIYLGRKLSPTLAWDYPTITSLSEYLAADSQSAEFSPTTYKPSQEETIAVIGLGCRFPGANDPEAFWQLLSEGVDAIREVPIDRWDADAYYAADPNEPGKTVTRWGGFLERVDEFDPQFFGISPREAARMDPQQRLLAEVAWETLENAGIAPDALAGSRTGVFVGISSYDYSRLQFDQPDLIDAYAGTGNAHSIAANRLSYLFDFRGPSVAVDTACSSSLISVHLACASLRNGEADLALAGGVNLILSPELTITFSQAHMMAPDGRCKTFDARADGYVRGEGCGLVVLKRLSETLRDGDNVLAVIRGSAVNQDGRSNGLTAPNGLSQQAVIRQALQAAGVSPRQIDYIEAHGTGTPLGDPIEVGAIRAVLESEPVPDEAVARKMLIGSVKTNIGHLESAAGIAGMIKVILAMKHEELPPHLHLEEVNPYIDLEGAAVAFTTSRVPWRRDDRPRLAGVSSFGFGGTNAHLILGEPPALNEIQSMGEMAKAQASRGEPRKVHLLTLSARTESALRALAGRYAERLENGGVDLGDFCFSANTGRAQLEHRLALIIDAPEKASSALEKFSVGESAPNCTYGYIAPGQKKRIAFLFTGQGSQYPNMGRQLYAREPAFKEALDRCAAILDAYLDVNLLSVLFAKTDSPEAGLIDDTKYTQPVLFALEYALAVLWRSWGIEPDFVLGHSVGEYVAACLAGVFSLEDGLKLIAARGRLMGTLPIGGAMAAVFADAEKLSRLVEPYLDRVSIAASNGPENTVIAGEVQSVEAVLAACEEEGLASKALNVSHAFHSPLMEPILRKFEAIASDVAFQAPKLPYISNLTGERLADDFVPDASYWRDHIRQTVRFSEGMRSLAENGAEIFLEVGPQPVLVGMGKRCLPGDSAAWLSTLRREQEDWSEVLSALAGLFVNGTAVDWAGYEQGYRHRKVSLPNYPFDRKRHWIDAAPRIETGRATLEASEDPVQKHPVLGNRLNSPIQQHQIKRSLPVGPEGEESLGQMIRAAGEVHFGPGEHKISFINFSDEPLVSNQPIALQTLATAQAGGALSVEIHVYLKASGTWRRLAAGLLERGEEADAVEEVPAKREADIRKAIREARGAEGLSLIQTLLSREAARILGIEEQRLAQNQPLDTLGLDSLMAMELRNKVEERLEVVLPIAELLKGPTMASLAVQVGELMDGSTGSPLALQPVAGGEGQYPLSHGQQALWFLHQLIPDDLSFNVAGAVRIRGDLQVDALQCAFQQIIDRHAPLRSVFKTSSTGEPVQRVVEQFDFHLQVIGAAGWSESRLKEELLSQAYQPFDLEQSPPLRAALYRLSHSSERSEAGEFVLLIALDHLVTDFWSMTIIAREVVHVYQSTVKGVLSELEPLRVSYGDYVRWHRERLGGDEGERLWRYWQSQLEGELPLLDLPTDRPRKPVQAYRGDSVSVWYSGELARGLRELGKDQGATLFMTLLAAFQTLLYRYTNQEEFLVGSVTAGRSHPELVDLVGYFINPVALWADFRDEPTFLGLLGRVRQTVLEAFEHQDYPPALLAERLRPQRDPSRPPLFETMFILQKAQIAEMQGFSPFALGIEGAQLHIDGLQLESVALGGQPAQFDLTLMMAETEDGLSAALQYNTDLFERETIEHILDHFESLLSGIVASPGRSVSEYPLLSAYERERILVDWNDTSAPYPQNRCIQELIEAQALSTPEASAVQFESNTLTYRELDRRAERLGRHLRNLGVGPESIVAIYLERSLMLPVGLLGILKAGGAYLPLDPAYPRERIGFMLADSQAKVLVTQRDLVDQLPEHQARLVLMDEDWEADDTQSPENPVNRPEPGNLAYVIYTSGSTGKPKGVQITHRSVVNFLNSMRHRPGLTNQDGLLAVTTPSFDIAALELFLPLTVGGRVIIASREMAADGVLLARLLGETRASVMQATPATWRMLIEAGWPGQPGLKMLCGGETLPVELAERLLQLGGELWNMYGPTETTIWSTVKRVECADELITIGRPIDNTQIYILDGKMQPVPLGVVGDLYIGGDGVARGYLNRQELTHERFVLNPFSSKSGVRLYKTGDLARFRPNGEIVFLGRSDNQVKLRGFRIELGEIEAALAGHLAVDQAVVAARPDKMGETSLAAYLIFKSGVDQPTSGELRAFLRQSLPDYMLPSWIISLDSLPLTPNGKIDRHALPTPDQKRSVSTAEYVPPRNSLEAELAEICAEVLGLSPDSERPGVGVHDNFFDLGGHSLLGARLIFRLREQYQVELPLRHLFAEPTVAGLARAIEIAREGGDTTGGNGGFSIEPFSRMTVDELSAEVRLDESITAGDLEYTAGAEPEHVLLTGATGFVGAFLLHELLQESSAHVHCLVRASSSIHGLERVRQNLASYGLWDSSIEERIIPIPGDLEQPLLGLDEVTFNRLASHIDVIFHNGAMVNFVYPYMEHKPANVLGTQEVLRLAARSRLKPVHFVSTLSVFHTGAHDDGVVYREDEVLAENGAPFGGYAQSKWVAEGLVQIAIDRGIPCSIYRPGLVGGHSRTGARNTADMISSMSKACLELGVIPDLDVDVSIVPVDYVSKAIVQLSKAPDSLGKVYHLDNPEPGKFREILKWIQSMGLEFRRVSFEEWQAELFERALKQGNEGWMSFLPLVEAVDQEMVYMPRFDCRNTVAGLSESSVSCPPVDFDLLSTYLNHFLRSEFIKLPKAKG